VAVRDLDREADAAVAVGTLGQRGDEAPSPRRRAQPRMTIGMRVAAELRELGEERIGTLPTQRDRLLVEHRLGEAGVDEHVAEVVHVDEAGRRRRPAARRVELAQLAQCSGPEAREDGDAFDVEQAQPPCDERRRIDDEVQRHVGPDELRAPDRCVVGALLDDGRGGTAECPPRTSLGGAAARRPRRIGLDRDALGTRVRGTHDVVAAARARPPFDDAARLQADRRQPLDETARDLAVQPRHRVAACDAREGPYRDFRLTDDQREALHIASWLHDCGKVTTPEYVVDKATKLSTIYDRIHEVRTRFEVLKRDAEIAFWKDRLADGDEGTLALRLAAQLRALDEDFAFIASCNVGSEAMDDAAIERIHHIAQRTWQRTLDDRIGISWEELARKERRPAQALPATESLLSDAPEHLIERQSGDLMPDDNRWGFRLTVPHHRYNLGEVHNLSVRRGTLTAEERYKINDHIVQTIVMLENLPFPRHLADVPEIAGGHHETMDGRGYPRRLVGGQMSTLARMMAIADIFEALTAVDRPYKKGKALSESLRIMARMRDERHIDGDLFDLFLTSGVYRRYAETYLDKNQMDDVDVEALRGDDAPLRDRPVPA